MAHKGKRRGHAKHLDCLRLWLATKPAKLTQLSYKLWAGEHNESLGPDDVAVVVSAAAICEALHMAWPDAILVARGAIEPEVAKPRPRRHRELYLCRGPHALVSMQQVGEILGVTRDVLQSATRQPAFPRPVVSLPRKRFWLREDIEAYRDGREFPDRIENQLQNAYLTVKQVAAMSQLSQGSIHSGGGGVPPCAVRLGLDNLWLRDEIDAWLEQRNRIGKRADGEAC